MEANHVENAGNAENVSSVPSVPVVEAGNKTKKPMGMGASLKRTENILGWVYISPMVIGLLVFTAIPIIMSIMAMFYQ